MGDGAATLSLLLVLFGTQSGVPAPPVATAGLVFMAASS